MLLWAQCEDDVGGSEGGTRWDARLTRLKDEGARDLDISAIAGGLNALAGADEGADDESGGLAYFVKGTKFDGHGRRRREWSRECMEGGVER